MMDFNRVYQEVKLLDAIRDDLEVRRVLLDDKRYAQAIWRRLKQFSQWAGITTFEAADRYQAHINNADKVPPGLTAILDYINRQYR